MAVYSEIYIENVRTFCRKNIEFLIVKPGGMNRPQ